MNEQIKGQTLKVFIGHGELWPELGQSDVWKSAGTQSSGLRCLRIVDRAGVRWRLIEFVIGTKLTVEQVWPALEGADGLPDSVIYYHRWKPGTGGGDEAFSRELGRATEALVLGFNGRDPDPLRNRGFYLLSKAEQEVAGREDKLTQSLTEGLFIDHLPSSGEGADIVKMRIHMLRALAAGPPNDREGRDTVSHQVDTLIAAVHYFVDSNPSEASSALVQQGDAIKSLVGRWNPADVSHTLQPAVRMLDDLERSLAAETQRFSRD